MSESFSDNVSDQELDRLVDGELCGSEYHRLLIRLEAAPDGWRRCALAFLESQAWERDISRLPPAEPEGLGDARSQPLEEPGQSTSTRRLPACVPSPGRAGNSSNGRRPHTNYRFLVLAMAASFLLALAGGVAVRQWRPPINRQQLTEVVPRETHDRSLPIAADAGSGRDTAVGHPRALGHATFVVNTAGGEAEEVELPVYGSGEAQGSWSEDVAAVPEELERVLHRLGYELRREVRWKPFELENGHHLFVPLGEVEIVPVSQRSLH